jgi:alpha-tubulin suppressor-like RCC1 family protein
MAMGRERAGGAKKLIGAGQEHSLATTGKEGEVLSFGNGMFGQLGHGREGNAVVPRLIEALRGVVVKHVAAGGFHSMVLTGGGEVFTWGRGYFGQLGHGDMDRQLVPKQVEGLTNVTDIAAGYYHGMAVGEGGTMYTWGDNGYGQLGLGDHGEGTRRHVPTVVPGVNEVVAVGAGTRHSFALSRDGTVMACGWNSSGQLGLGETDDRDTFTVVAGLRGVVDIDAGEQHTIAATVGGGFYAWGTGQGMGHGGDEETQCIVPTKLTGGGIGEAVVVQVAAGNMHSMALTTTGDLYAWGNGDQGQLGHGGKEDLAVPRVVSGVGVAVLGMAGGSEHSLVITAEGRVLAFGSNGEEQYEDSDEEELDEPVVVVDGRLGLGAGVAAALTPTAIDGITMGEDGKDEKE